MGTVTYKATIRPKTPILPEPTRVELELQRQMERFGVQIENQGKLNVTGGARVGESKPRNLSVRSGALRDSITAFYHPGRKILYYGAGLGPSRAYAAAHEMGRPWPLRPKRKKYLLIPLAPYLTKAGASAQTVSGNRVWQDYDFTLVPIGKGGGSKGKSKGTAKTRHGAIKREAPKKDTGRSQRSIKGKGFVAIEKSSGLPWYLLLKKVGPLRARPYLYPSIIKHEPAFLRGMGQQMLTQALAPRGKPKL